MLIVSNGNKGQINLPTTTFTARRNNHGESGTCNAMLSLEVTRQILRPRDGADDRYGVTQDISGRSFPLVTPPHIGTYLHSAARATDPISVATIPSTPLISSWPAGPGPHVPQPSDIHTSRRSSSEIMAG